MGHGLISQVMQVDLFFFFAYAYVCRCVCIWKPKVDIRQLPQSLPTSVFEAEYLTELGAHQLASRTASLADHLFFPLS